MTNFANKKLKLWLRLFAIILILDTVIVFSAKAGANLGTFFPGIVGGILLFRNKIGEHEICQSFIGVLCKFQRFFKTVFLIGLLLFIIIEMLIISSAFSNQWRKTDCVLVLGAGIQGEELSVVLRERLELCLKYLKTNPGAKVIVSGGMGFGATISEAEAMQRFLVKNGVDAKDIIKEEKSTSTSENLRYSKQLYYSQYKEPLKEIVIITSDFHLFRTKMLARREGLIPYGIGSKTAFYLYPHVCTREFLAVIKSFLFDR